MKYCQLLKLSMFFFFLHHMVIEMLQPAEILLYHFYTMQYLFDLCVMVLQWVVYGCQKMSQHVRGAYINYFTTSSIVTHPNHVENVLLL